MAAKTMVPRTEFGYIEESIFFSFLRTPFSPGRCFGGIKFLCVRQAIEESPTLSSRTPESVFLPFFLFSIFFIVFFVRVSVI